jgi:hypothetical protein
MARVKIRVYFWDCVRPALSLGDHLITTAEAERERGITSTTHQYILTHTQYERADQAPNIGSDDYRNIRRQSAVLISSLRAPPKSQPQVPAPACPLPPTPTEFTLHYYTSLLPHTPALHATTNSPNCCCSTVLSHSLNLSYRHPSLDNTNHHPFALTNTHQTHKPHHPRTCICSHQASRKSSLVRLRLFDRTPESTHRRQTSRPSSACLSVRKNSSYHHILYQPPCKPKPRRLEELKTSATASRIAIEELGYKANSSYKCIPAQS